MEELLFTTLSGTAVSSMLLAVTMFPIGLVIGIGLGVVWAVERYERDAAWNTMVVMTAMAKLLALLVALIRGYS
jgi:hypothetical protein